MEPVGFCSARQADRLKAPVCRPLSLQSTRLLLKWTDSLYQWAPWAKSLLLKAARLKLLMRNRPLQWTWLLSWVSRHAVGQRRWPPIKEQRERDTAALEPCQHSLIRLIRGLIMEAVRSLIRLLKQGAPVFICRPSDVFHRSVFLQSGACWKLRREQWAVAVFDQINCVKWCCMPESQQHIGSI